MELTVTDNQKAIIDSGSSFKEIRIEFPNNEIADIENNRICMNTMSLEESLSDQNNIVFGKCNGSIFKIRVADFSGDIENVKMNVYINYVNDDLGNVEIPFGKYIISQNPQRTSDRKWRDITATDYMTLFDVDIADWYNTVLYPTSTTKRTVKTIRDMLCNYIGVNYENATLINDNLLIEKTVEPENLSARDLLQNCCEVNACFGHFDWDGILRWIQLQSSNSTENEITSENYQVLVTELGEPIVTEDSRTITNTIRSYRNCEYGDYSVHNINSVAIVKEEGGLAVHYDQIPTGDKRNRYTITGNILLYAFNQNELESIAHTIYNNIYQLMYRPNTTDVFGHLYMNLGDLYEVNCNVVVGDDYIDSSFRSYMLKRTISGTQAIYQKMESKGEQILPETQSHDIMNTLSILKGKSAVYKRNLDALEIEYRDYERKTETRFIQTSESIKSTVARYDEVWNERGYVIYWKGYGLNDPIVVDSSEIRQPQVGDHYLDITTGKLYTINYLHKREGE